MQAQAASAPQSRSRARTLFLLALGSVGVVYGDIGTSPLYAFREALRPVADDGLVREEVVGLISLMIWTLTIIVTLKYVLFLLRADNHGEGGTRSLLALLTKTAGRHATVLFFMMTVSLIHAHRPCASASSCPTCRSVQ